MNLQGKIREHMVKDRTTAISSRWGKLNKKGTYEEKLKIIVVPLGIQQHEKAELTFSFHIQHMLSIPFALNNRFITQGAMHARKDTIWLMGRSAEENRIKPVIVNLLQPGMTFSMKGLLTAG